MLMRPEEYLWEEKYRPKTVEECILPTHLKDRFQSYVNDRNVPNLILTGSPGVGKTSVATAMLDELDCDYMKINSALKRGMDVIRDEVMTFASTVSFKEGRKYVIFDEADGILMETQKALNAFSEEFSVNCGFIFTCNNLNKINSAIQSRCDIVDFTLRKEDFVNLASKFMKSLEVILEKENVTFDKQVLAGVIKKFYPDWRHVLVALHAYAIKNRRIDSGILATALDDSLKPLVGFLKEKKWSDMRKWVGENPSIVSDFNAFAQKLFKEIEKLIELKSQPLYVTEYNNYDYRAAFVGDKETNTVAFLTDIMAGLIWK